MVTGNPLPYIAPHNHNYFLLFFLKTKKTAKSSCTSPVTANQSASSARPLIILKKPCFFMSSRWFGRWRCGVSAALCTVLTLALTCWQNPQTGCGASSPVAGCSPSPGCQCSAAAPSPSPCRSSAPACRRWAWCSGQSEADPPPSWTAGPSRSTEDRQPGVETHGGGIENFTSGVGAATRINELQALTYLFIHLFILFPLDMYPSGMWIPAEYLISPMGIGQTSEVSNINNVASRDLEPLHRPNVLKRVWFVYTMKWRYEDWTWPCTFTSTGLQLVLKIDLLFFFCEVQSFGLRPQTSRVLSRSRSARAFGFCQTEEQRPKIKIK